MAGKRYGGSPLCKAVSIIMVVAHSVSALKLVAHSVSFTSMVVAHCLCKHCNGGSPLCYSASVMVVAHSEKIVSHQEFIHFIYCIPKSYQVG